MREPLVKNFGKQDFQVLKQSPITKNVQELTETGIPERMEQ